MTILFELKYEHRLRTMSHTVPHMSEVKAGPLSGKPLNTIIEATNSIPETTNTLGNQQMMQLVSNLQFSMRKCMLGEKLINGIII